MVLPLLLAVYGPAWGGYKEGLAAIQRGDYGDALSEWQPVAEQGNASAQYNLGQLYRDGLGVTQDYKEAEKWYLSAAENGLAAAQFTLGVMYLNGEGVPKDNVQAYMWFSLARANGIEEATHNQDAAATQMTYSQIGKAQSLARKWVRRHPGRARKSE